GRVGTGGRPASSVVQAASPTPLMAVIVSPSVWLLPTLQRSSNAPCSTVKLAWATGPPAPSSIQSHSWPPPELMPAATGFPMAVLTSAWGRNERAARGAAAAPSRRAAADDAAPPPPPAAAADEASPPPAAAGWAVGGVELVDAHPTRTRATRTTPETDLNIVDPLRSVGRGEEERLPRSVADRCSGSKQGARKRRSPRSVGHATAAKRGYSGPDAGAFRSEGSSA